MLDALIRRRAAGKGPVPSLRRGAAPTPAAGPPPPGRPRRGVPTGPRPAEIEAPLAGERAEVRLVEPYDVEPSEAPTAFTPPPAAATAFASQPAVEPRPIVIETREVPVEATEEVPTAFTADHAPIEAGPAAVEAPLEETPTAFTAEPEVVEDALLEEAPTAFAAEPEPAPPAVAEVLADETPTAFTVEPEPAAEAASIEAAPFEEGPTASTPEREPETSHDAALAAAPEALISARWAVEVEAEWEGPAASTWIVETRPTPAPTAFAPEPGPEAAVEPEPAEEPWRKRRRRPSRSSRRANPSGPPNQSLSPSSLPRRPRPSRRRVSLRRQTRDRRRDGGARAAALLELRADGGCGQALVQADAVPRTGTAAGGACAGAGHHRRRGRPAGGEPLTLTSPPADWEAPRVAQASAGLAAEADELETPLFDEGWDGPGALSGRIVRHEAPAEHDARTMKLGVTGPVCAAGLHRLRGLRGRAVRLLARARGQRRRRQPGRPGLGAGADRRRLRRDLGVFSPSAAWRSGRLIRFLRQ